MIDSILDFLTEPYDGGDRAEEVGGLHMLREEGEREEEKQKNGGKMGRMRMRMRGKTVIVIIRSEDRSRTISTLRGFIVMIIHQ